jgi:hypothetical protein
MATRRCSTTLSAIRLRASDLSSLVEAWYVQVTGPEDCADEMVDVEVEVGEGGSSRSSAKPEAKARSFRYGAFCRSKLSRAGCSAPAKLVALPSS